MVKILKNQPAKPNKSPSIYKHNWYAKLGFSTIYLPIACVNNVDFGPYDTFL